MTPGPPPGPRPDPPAGTGASGGDARGPDDGPARIDSDGSSITDALVATCGVLGALLLVAADRGQRLGLGLLALALLATMTALATHTAVVGRQATRRRRILGAVIALVATVLFMALSAHRTALLVPALAVAAGLGRTGSWPWRLVGLAALALGAVLV